MPRIETTGDQIMIPNRRYIVELRPPKHGEMYVTNNVTAVAECDYDDFPEDHRWTVIDTPTTEHETSE